LLVVEQSISPSSSLNESTSLASSTAQSHKYTEPPEGIVKPEPPVLMFLLFYTPGLSLSNEVFI